jgi:hypothetical protein
MAMKRSGFGPRKSSLKRSTFALPDRQKFERNQEAKKRVGLKRKAKRPTVAEGSKYLEACRGERCYLRTPGCVGGGETVVPCHSNQSKHGKGMGIKADHRYTVPGCWVCHSRLDQGIFPREQKNGWWDSAYAEWAPVRARKMGIEQQEMEAA